MSRKTRRLLWQSFKVAGADKVVIFSVAFFLIISLLLYLIEPNIHTLPDSMWYCFAVVSTVGFGDITVMSFPGRILTVILSIYSVAFVAIFSAIITSFFLELARARVKDSVHIFMDDLEHLPELSRDELWGLSEKIKHFK